MFIFIYKCDLFQVKEILTQFFLFHCFDFHSTLLFTTYTTYKYAEYI